jgi:hypothetical protein
LYGGRSLALTGGVYCISATTLQSVYALEIGPWCTRLCAYLRHRAPVAGIGYSIFVFDLNDDEINRVLYGPAAELTREASVRGF